MESLTDRINAYTMHTAPSCVPMTYPSSWRCPICTALVVGNFHTCPMRYIVSRTYTKV